jgi:hypothetical protein
MVPTDKRLYFIRRAQKKAKNAKAPNPSIMAKLLETSKLVKGPKSALVAYVILIRLIIIRAFNVFSDFETITGSDYCFKNSVLFNSKSTCNIRNAESRFILKSFRPPREEDENIIFINDALMPIVSYKTIRLII